VVLELSGDNLMFPIDVTVDEATGLTTKGGSRYNNEQFSSTDFVSDPTGGGIPYALRTQFEQPSQFMATSTASLPSFYEHARSANPIIFMLDDPIEAQAEITRVGDFFEVLPGLFTCTVYFEGSNAQAMAQLMFGDIVKITYPRYGFDDGKKCTIVDTVLSPAAFSLQLVVWRPQE